MKWSGEIRRQFSFPGYKGKLESNADDFIDDLMDGSQRVRGLIGHRLARSRLNNKGKLSHSPA